MEYGTSQVCQRCKSLFTYSGYGHYYCPACKKKDENDFDKVRDYIQEHGTATIMEVVIETKVDKKYVDQYLREGRLEIPENSPIFIKCERCGCDIRSGKYCQDCGTLLNQKLKGALNIYEVGEKPKVKSDGAMRFLNRDKK